MADKLRELYKKWLMDAKPTEEFSLQCFQAGLTVGAVSMRQRAQTLAQKLETGKFGENDLVNAIGQLSDIPEN